MYAVSKQLLKLSLSFAHDNHLLDKALLSLELAEQQEQNLLLEIIGGVLDRFCIYDEVFYLERALKTMPHLLSNDPMIVMKVNSVDLEKEDSLTTATLFNKSDQKFIDVHLSQLKPIPLLK